MNQPLRVLMVEDSENDAALLLCVLRREGYEKFFRREIMKRISSKRLVINNCNNNF
jgi:hypothetical protein